jgi:hypothetical protein
MIRSLLPLLSLLSVPVSAWAQADEVTPELFSSTTVIEEDAFGYLTVEGELVGPDGQVSQERRVATFSPMIRIRLDFAQEMVESLDEIQ